MATFNPRYPNVNLTVLSILVAAVLEQPRSFASDARSIIRRLDPPLILEGSFPSHADRGLVVAMNHYSRPGFGAWWIALAVAAACPWEMHWIATSAWVYEDPLRSLLITPPSRWLLRRLARIYNITSMPPMPPRPQDVEQRARAVRAVLGYVARTSSPVLGFAPEGADSDGGQLSPPPSGVGRFLAHLLKRGMKILPVGVFESHRGLTLSIGTVINPEIPKSSRDQDRRLSQVTMEGIAAQLPATLRGPYR